MYRSFQRIGVFSIAGRSHQRLRMLGRAFCWLSCAGRKRQDASSKQTTPNDCNQKTLMIRWKSVTAERSGTAQTEAPSAGEPDSHSVNATAPRKVYTWIMARGVDRLHTDASIAIAVTP